MYKVSRALPGGYWFYTKYPVFSLVDTGSMASVPCLFPCCAAMRTSLPPMMRSSRGGKTSVSTRDSVDVLSWLTKLHSFQQKFEFE